MIWSCDGAGSPVFVIRLGETHLILDGVTDETVQAFSLAGGKVLDDLTLPFFDDNIDSIVCFFVIPSGCLLLGIGVFSHIAHPTFVFTLY